MESDPNKRRKNLRKHGIDLPCCDEVFSGPALTHVDSRFEYLEERYLTFGWSKGRLVAVVWTDSEDGPRLISCRETTSNEKQFYAKHIGQH